MVFIFQDTKSVRKRKPNKHLKSPPPTPIPQNTDFFFTGPMPLSRKDSLTPPPHPGIQPKMVVVFRKLQHVQKHNLFEAFLRAKYMIGHHSWPETQWLVHMLRVAPGYFWQHLCPQQFSLKRLKTSRKIITHNFPRGHSIHWSCIQPPQPSSHGFQ